MALSDEELRKYFTAAAQKWAKRKSAELGERGFFDDPVTLGVRRYAEGILTGGDELEQTVSKQLELYKRDPSTYSDRVSGGKHSGLFQEMFEDLDPTVRDYQEGAAPGAEGGPQQPSGTDLLRQFGAAMLKPWSADDPFAKQIIGDAQRQASASATARGLNGGYAVSNIEQAGLRAGNEVQMQRNAIGVQALGSAEGLSMQQAQMDQANYMQQYQAQQAAMQQRYQQRLGSAQATGATIGGIGGAVVGGYFGGPAGAQAGMAAGSQFGAGVAGGGVAGPGYVPFNPPARRPGTY